MASSTEPVVHPIPGIRLGVASAGIKVGSKRDDLVLIEIGGGSETAVITTRNAFAAAPVTITREHLEVGEPCYLLINSGNANAGTGRQGLADARRCCEAISMLAAVPPTAVLPFSTGVIGEPLPMDRLLAALPQAHGALREDAWLAAAQAIMTTDTVAKVESRRLFIDGHEVRLTGIAKGSGMIHPDMATLLAFIATDAPIDRPVLEEMLTRSAASSFNAITVDGDTSTNDACALMATGRAGLPRIRSLETSAAEVFCQSLTEISESLARQIVRDGEGATKLITLVVEEGEDVEACRRVALTVAHSPLVKTAFFASDPNWGRILAAVGRAGLPGLAIDDVRIWIGDVCIVSRGGRDPDYSEERGQLVMRPDEITVRIALGRGQARYRLWTCDLSYDYVRINAEYRT